MQPGAHKLMTSDLRVRNSRDLHFHHNWPTCLKVCTRLTNCTGRAVRVVQIVWRGDGCETSAQPTWTQGGRGLALLRNGSIVDSWSQRSKTCTIGAAQFAWREEKCRWKNGIGLLTSPLGVEVLLHLYPACVYSAAGFKTSKKYSSLPIHCSRQWSCSKGQTLSPNTMCVPCASRLLFFYNSNMSFGLL